jgi:hypothetical protein
MGRSEIVVPARVERGRLHLDREALAAQLQEFDDGHAIVRIARRKAHRSQQANNYYWGVVIALTADYCGYEPEEMHDAFKLKFLRSEDTDHPLPTVKSTASLTTDEFWDYIDQIKRFAASELGVYVPDPQ